MLWVTLYLVLSGILLALAWPQLRFPGRHGFYRFFAFEALFGLILFGAPAWFVDPLSAWQVASWILLAGSLGLAIHGFVVLHRYGAPRGSIETTRRLVREGIYRSIRHPLYLSLMLAGTGAALKRPGAWSAGLLLALGVLLLATARVEERENVARFGAEYQDYMRHTRRFIPFLF